MTTKQYYEQNTVFAHMCRLMLFCKCIINQRQCRTDVEESVGFFTRNGYVR
jgi:hypothetical protein